MKAVIKPKNNQEEVMNNMRKISKIFTHPASRFTLKTTLPKKYRRGALGFKLAEENNTFIFSMNETPLQKQSQKQIREGAEKFLIECDGDPKDFDIEVIL